MLKCETCLNETTCETCPSNLFLYEDKHCGDCSEEGFYKSNKNCLKCTLGYNCKTCTISN